MVSGEPLNLGSGYHVVGVLVLRKLGSRGLAQLIALRVERIAQIGTRFQHGAVGVEVGHEARADHRAVLVGDVGVAQDVIRLQHVSATRRVQTRHRRREQEEADAVHDVEVADARKDGERWVVHDNAPVGVLFALVVAIGPERTNKVGAVKAISLRDPVGDDVVNLWRRVAVVGRLLRLELLHKRGVLWRLVRERHLHAHTKTTSIS